MIKLSFLAEIGAKLAKNIGKNEVFEQKKYAHFFLKIGKIKKKNGAKMATNRQKTKRWK